MKKIFLFIMMVWFASISAFADETIPLVVWQDAGNLSVLQGGNIQTFPIGDLIFPYLSPNGDQVALVRGQYPYPQSLAVISIIGENLRDVGVAYPRQVIWQSETVLWVNGYLPPTEGMLELSPSAMLYRVNLETGDITEWDMGASFEMSINPAHDWMALTFAGLYGQVEGHISLLSLTENNPTPQDMMTFPAISSGSHGGYYPSVQWVGDDRAYVAIPHPDAIYNTTTDADTAGMSLFELTTDGGSDVFGTIHALFFYPPLWSSDGEVLAYVTATPDESRFVIVTHDGVETLYSQTWDMTENSLFLSIPNSDEFLYIQRNTAIMIVGAEVGLHQWTTGGGAFVADIVLYPRGAVFTLLNDFSIALVYAGWDDNMVHEILKMTEYPFFDANWD
jgi:hypothetical protein